MFHNNKKEEHAIIEDSPIQLQLETEARRYLTHLDIEFDMPIDKKRREVETLCAKGILCMIDESFRDYPEALTYLNKAFEKGSRIAACYLGILHEYGLGIPSSMQAAMFYYAYHSKIDYLFPLQKIISGLTYLRSLQSCLYGNACAAAELFRSVSEESVELYCDYDYKPTLAFIEQQADQEKVSANALLAIVYTGGLLGIPKDLCRASKFFDRVANSEDAWLQYNLGVAYKEGFWFDKNDEQAERWLWLAAEKNLPLAKKELTLFYQQRSGGKNREMQGGLSAVEKEDDLPIMPSYLETPPKLDEFAEVLTDSDVTSMLDTAEGVEVKRALGSFTAKSREQLSVSKGDLLFIIRRLGQWTYCQHGHSQQEGLVPSAFLRRIHTQPNAVSAAMWPLPEALKVSENSLYPVGKEGLLLGKGSFGVVYQKTWHGISVAVKVFSKSISDGKLDIDVHKELKIMGHLDHPNIVRLCAYTCDTNIPSLVMEYMDRGALSSYLGGRSEEDSQKLLPYSVRYEIAINIAHALSYLHSFGIIHRDLKSQNVLLCSHNGNLYFAKIADFGLSCVQKRKTGSPLKPILSKLQVGSLPYLAPEILLGRESGVYHYSSASDMYALAILFLELMTHELPFSSFIYPHYDEDKLIAHILSGRRDAIPDGAPDVLQAITKRGWAAEPEFRPSALEVLETLIQRKEVVTTANMQSDSAGNMIINLQDKSCIDKKHQEQHLQDRMVSSNNKPNISPEDFEPYGLHRKLSQEDINRLEAKKQEDAPWFDSEANQWSDEGFKCLDNNDYQTAEEFFNKAAARNFPRGWAGLVNIYAEGSLGKKDPEKVEKLFHLVQDSAATGNAVGQFCLGWMYKNGYVVKEDQQEAAKWYYLSAKQGFAIAQSALGLIYAEGNGVDEDYEETAKWYHLSAVQSYAIAQHRLGKLYENGKSVKQSYEEALKWYLLSAQQGNEVAQRDVGRLYRQGYLLKVEEVEALENVKQENAPWFNHELEKLANKAFQCLEEKEYKTAVGLFKDIASKNYPIGWAGLAQIYAQGLGVDKNSAEAKRLFDFVEKSAATDDAVAQCYLGWMYYYGYGVKPSRQTALRCYRRSAKQGYGRAQYNLGKMYGEKDGQTKSHEEAVMWYRLSAMQGDAHAQYNLGQRYEQGYGVLKSLNEAATWYRLSMKNGHLNAQSSLMNIYCSNYYVLKQEEIAELKRKKQENASWFNGELEALIEKSFQCLEKKEYAEAYRLFKEIASRNYPLGWAGLAKMHTEALGVDENPEEAENLFDLTHENALSQDAVGQFCLGWMYCYGYGAARNYKLSVLWYRLSAEQGYAQAQYALGKMYENGTGGKLDRKEAAMWGDLSAEQKMTGFQHNLYERDKNIQAIKRPSQATTPWYHFGIERKMESTAYPLKQTELQNHSEVYRLSAEEIAKIKNKKQECSLWFDKEAEELANQGFQYLEKKDYRAALAIFNDVADKNYPLGWIGLAKIYTKGLGVADKPAEVKKLYCLIEKSAAAGHPVGQYCLGRIYQYGYGVTKSYQRSLEWYRLSAKQGYAVAQSELGWLYESGRVGDKNYPEAMQWYRFSVEQGNPKAQYRLGSLYKNGYGTNPNYREAIRLYHLSVAQAYAKAQFSLGLMYEQGYAVPQNYREAVRLYHLSAEQGCSNAQCSLGGLYEKGLGVDQDYREAAKWYRLSAERGDIKAQNSLKNIYCRKNFLLNEEDIKRLKNTTQDNALWFNRELDELANKADNFLKKKEYEAALSLFKELASRSYPRGWYGLIHIYSEGLGVEKNAEELKVLCDLAKKSAAAGNAVGQLCLGAMYTAGHGVERSPELAVLWSRLSAEQGYAVAQDSLALYYWHGTGVEKNYKEALHWYRLSAAQGNAIAQYNLGWMYKQGYGVEKDYGEAAKWYRLSAEQKYEKAQHRLGWLYEKGWGVEQDYQEAAKWYRLSAEQGDVVAQNGLGWLYENGYGVEKNYREAVHWYHLAGQKGNLTAANSLMKLAEQGERAAIDAVEQFFHSIISNNGDQAFRWLRLACKISPAGINRPNVSDGDTPLHSAIRLDNLKLAKLLILYNANVFAKNKAGITPQELLINKKEAWFVTEEHKELLALMLVNESCDLLKKGFSFVFTHKIRDKMHDIFKKNSDISEHSSSWIMSKKILQGKVGTYMDRKYYHKVFEEMEKSVYLSPLMGITAFSLNNQSLTMVLDVNSKERNKEALNSRELATCTHVTLGISTGCYGIYEHAGVIYIGAKTSGLSERSQISERGTLAHEITHFVMDKVFRNNAKPYKQDDKEAIKEFSNICDRIYGEAMSENGKIPEIILQVYDRYSENKWHSELIARVPEMVAMGLLAHLEVSCRDLLEYYKTKILPACEDCLFMMHFTNNVYIKLTGYTGKDVLRDSAVKAPPVFENAQPALTTQNRSDKNNINGIVNPANVPQYFFNKTRETVSQPISNSDCLNMNMKS